jgi:probable rRNA maturation factor
VAPVIEVEVIGHRALDAGAPSLGEVRRLCDAAAAAQGVHAGHLAVHFVGERRIRELNRDHRDKDAPTDVLSFPIDGADLARAAGSAGADGGPPAELGDVFICAQWTADLRTAVVHGVLHLVGMDHETDSGEMLALQAQLLAETAGVS